MAYESSESPQPTNPKSEKRRFSVPRFIKKPLGFLRPKQNQQSETEIANIERRLVEIEEFNPKDLYETLYGWKDVGEIDTGIGLVYGYEIEGPDQQKWDLQIDQYSINGGTLYMGNGNGVEFQLDGIKTAEFIGRGIEVRMNSNKGTYIIDKYNHEFVSKDGSSMFVFHPPVTAAPDEVRALK